MLTTTVSMEAKKFLSWRRNSQMHPAMRVVFFVIGLSLGFTASLYFKALSYYVQASLLSTSTPMISIQSPILPPPPPPVPLFESTSSATTDAGEGHEVRVWDEIPLMKNISDEELLYKASMVPGQVSKENAPKVAFMFLVNGRIPFATLWEWFFKGHEGFYSIYVHPNPFHNDSWPQHSVFYGRRIFSRRVFWGTSTMVDAERRLLARALLDPSNRRFVLLSESCIPLFDFKTVYNYLINSKLSMVQSYDVPGKDTQDRYNRNMWPLINLSDWRKGSQWFEARRDLAIHIVSDQKYFRVFQLYCQPRKKCYADEHYIPTFCNIMFPELISNRSVTYVDWSRRGVAHPANFGPENVTAEFLNVIRHGSECVYNGGNTSMCFLFGRKFTTYSLGNLRRLAPTLLGYGPN